MVMLFLPQVQFWKYSFDFNQYDGLQTTLPGVYHSSGKLLPLFNFVMNMIRTSASTLVKS